MTRFEEIGVEIQYGAASKRKAQVSFRYSCNVCCNRGMQIDCDRCAIACAHETVVESFKDLEAFGKSPRFSCYGMIAQSVEQPDMTGVSKVRMLFNT